MTFFSRNLPLLILGFFLFIVPALSSQNIPSEASIFAGSGLRLFPLGWSSEGRWATLVWRDAEAGGPSFQVIVMDAVNDQELYRSKPIAFAHHESLAILWKENTDFFSKLSSVYGIEFSDKPDARRSSFQVGEQDYNFSLLPVKPLNETYRIIISSSLGGRKKIYESPSQRPPYRSEALGILLSPFEARALILVRETATKGGLASYRFSGAHLTLGFQQPPRGKLDLISAVINGQEYLLLHQLHGGADPNIPDARGYSPLLIAARLGHWNIMGHLLKAQASVQGQDSNGRSALHHAAYGNALEVVRLLLKAGAYKEAKDKAGLGPKDLTTDLAIRKILQ